MTIIQFNPNAWQGIENSSINQQKQIYTRHVEPHGFGYCDEILEDEVGFFAKLKNLFKNKTIPTIKASLTTEEAQNKAQVVLKETMLTKDEIIKLIYKGIKNDYNDITNHAGNLVTFEQDGMGRGIMIEHDRKDKPARITTFALTDGSVYRIEEKIPHSRSYNKIIFFNYNNSHIEVRKGIKEGFSNESLKELYSFEKGRPNYYKKDCIMSPNGSVAKEEYYF